MALDTAAPNSQQVAINSQRVAINSQDMAIEQPVGSYEPEVFVPEDEVQKTTATPLPPTPDDMTPSAPISKTVVVVAETVAGALGEEATTTDGFMARAGVRPFDTFADAYPHHQGRRKANAEWDRQQLDATLPLILEALSWQQTLTGHAALPFYPHVYLSNKGWLDARPVCSRGAAGVARPGRGRATVQRAGVPRRPRDAVREAL